MISRVILKHITFHHLILLYFNEQVRPDTLLALLEAANQEAEEESETLMETFLQDGG